MPAIRVSRSIVIKHSEEMVFDTVADFGTWTRWSPWLCIDPQAVVTVSDDPHSVGSTYQWTGELVGAGEIKHVHLDRPQRIVQRLQFLKPFKSKAEVEFEFASVPGGTKLTWSMRSSLPWFLFWMRAQMETMIGMDYDRGLKMLKELIETGEVLSKTEVLGVETVDGLSLVGARGSAPMNDISSAMDSVITTVDESLARAGIAKSETMASAYHSCDFKDSGRLAFTTGYVLPESVTVAEPLIRCEIPAGKMLHVRHVGSYQNLGNAWNGAYQYAKFKKLKLARQDAYEIYVNDPTTPASQRITDIYLPVK